MPTFLIAACSPPNTIKQESSWVDPIPFQVSYYCDNTGLYSDYRGYFELIPVDSEKLNLLLDGTYTNTFHK